MPNPVKRGRPTVEDVLQVGRSTVGDVLQIGRNTVEEVLHVGRSTVEEVIQVGRNTVESARQLRQGTMKPQSSTDAKTCASNGCRFPEAAPGELIVRVGAALTCGTDLKVFRRGYHARMIKPPALFGHELAGTVVEAGEGVAGFVPATASLHSTPLPAASATSAGAARKISATICSSTTAPTLNTSASPLASSPRTPCAFPTTFPSNTPRSLSRWPALCMALMIPARNPATPSPSSAAAHWA